MSDPSKITFVICTYNNAGALDRALECLAAQTGVAAQSWSVLVVNNNCTDQIEQVVSDYQHAGRIPDLTMIRETKQGLSFARRRGLLNTRADWVAFIDDDNFLEPNWLQMLFGFLKQRPESSIIRISLESRA